MKFCSSLSKMWVKFIYIFFISTVILYHTGYGEDAETKENSPISINLEPFLYQLNIVVKMSETNLFSGTTVIEANCVKETNQILLNKKDLQIGNIEVHVYQQNGSTKENKYTIAKQYEDEIREHHIIELNTDLEVGHIVTLIVEYVKLAPARYHDAAFIKYSYITEPNGIEKWVALTTSGAGNTRRLYPCIGEESREVKVIVQITHHKDLISLSNTYRNEKLTSRTSVNDGEISDQFEPPVHLPLFSIEFVVGNLLEVSTEFDTSIKIRIWADETTAEHIGFVQNNILKIAKFYHQHFNTEYSTRTIDIVALRNYDSADKWKYGFITLDDSLITVRNLNRANNKTKTTEIALQLCDVFSHQYFGAQRTLSKRSENWLNIGFALFYRNTCIDKVFFRHLNVIFEAHLVESFIRVLDVNEEIKSHPLTLSDNFISLIENKMVTERAYFLVRMMNFILGENILRQCVEDYIRNYDFKVTNLKNVWDIFTENIKNEKLLPPDITLKDIMDSWSFEKKLPRIKTMRITEKKMDVITITQESDYIIPLNILTENDINNRNKSGMKYWLNKSEPLTINVNHDHLIIFNTNLNILYRVAYDATTLDLLTSTLQDKSDFESIPLFSRIHLLSDIFTLAYEKKLSYKNVFKTMQPYLKNELSPLPFIVVLGEFSKMHFRLLHASSSTYEIVQNYMETISETIFKRKQFSSNTRELYIHFEFTHFEKFCLTWACLFQLKFILNRPELVKLRKNEREENETIPEYLREPIFCAAVIKYGDHLWEIMWKFYDMKYSRTFNRPILYALGCILDEEKLKNYLASSLDPNKIAPEDSFTVFESLASNKYGYKIMKNFFSDHVNKILELYQGDPFKVYRYLQKLYEITGKKEDYDELGRITDIVKDKLGNIDAHLEASKLIALNNISWLDDFEANVNNYLPKHESSSKAGGLREILRTGFSIL